MTHSVLGPGDIITHCVPGPCDNESLVAYDNTSMHAGPGYIACQCVPVSDKNESRLC